MKKFALLIIISIISFSIQSYACTNFLVTKGASTDGSTFITYSADAGGFMEQLYHHKGGKHQPGEMIEVHDWDTGKFLGKIPQAKETYTVVGNMNEYQVSIGETTFTGRHDLIDTTGIIDYGSLMRLALQRAKTAREAIKVMDMLVQTYGYYSSGESFSIADPNEVWIMEMIGKGSKEKGAVWVARRIPDGYISAHANQARIKKVIKNDPDNCLYTPDVIEFAKKMDIYTEYNGEFSFADTYCPLDPGGLLYCEGRVWSFFNRAAPSLNLDSDYWRAVEGAEPYPLYIKPDNKLDVADVADLFRDHFENTTFDMRNGLAAGPYGCPYRWKGLGWKVEGDSTQYGWDRPISTQQTAFSFISQMRSWLPREIGGVFWYGVDDNYSSVYVPLYCAMTEVPSPYAKGSIKDFTLESSFWVFNLVANLAYTKYSYIIEDIQVVQQELENKFFAYQPAIDKAAAELYKTDPEMAVEYLTEYSVGRAEMVHDRWLTLWHDLVVKYNDGYINDVTKDNGRSPASSGYGDKFLKKVLEERPNYFKVEMKKKDIVDGADEERLQSQKDNAMKE